MSFHLLRFASYIRVGILRGFSRLKPWPNELASRPIFDLCSTCVSFGHPLASTCDTELRWLWSSSILIRKSTQVFHDRSATKRKSTQVDRKSTVYAWNVRVFAICVNLRDNLRIRLATRRKSVRKFWFCKLASTCESVWPGPKERLYFERNCTFGKFTLGNCTSKIRAWKRDNS